MHCYLCKIFYRWFTGSLCFHENRFFFTFLQCFFPHMLHDVIYVKFEIFFRVFVDFDYLSYNEEKFLKLRRILFYLALRASLGLQIPHFRSLPIHIFFYFIKFPLTKKDIFPKRLIF